MPRNTRQTTAQNFQASNPSGSISRDPVARRGAPKPSGAGKAASVASIATVPTRADGESDDEDEDEDSVSEVPIMGPGDQVESAPADDADDDDNGPNEQQCLIMMSLCADLTRATEEFHNRLQNKDNKNPICHQTILDIKRKAFETLFEAYADPKAPKAKPLFIDFGWAADLDQSSGRDSAVAKTVALANLVVGLDEIHRIDGGETSNVVPFLKSLNTSFPHLFLSPHCLERYPDLAVAIGTCFLSRGGRKTRGIGKVKETYPLASLVKELKAWFLERYTELRAEVNTNSSKNGSHDVYYDATDTIPESMPDSNPGSQEIIRQPPPNVKHHMGPSLFKDKSSLLELKANAGRFRPPPSNQQQTAPSEAPSDYPEHSTPALLADDLIPASSGQMGHKRRHITGQDVDEDDEDDDEFQTDARQVDEGRRATIAADQQKKRKKLASQRFSSMAPPPLPASRSSAPISSRRQDPISSMPSPSSRVPISSADTEAIRHQKATVIASARARSSHGLEMRQKQRTAWSDHDTELLRSLIAPCQAKWADIERLHTEDFEHPRNQQAYRDKARNMKVDYLISDAVLPPGFDLVALGKKEVVRLQQLGKNPDRKEDDYQREGEYFRAINTEYCG